MMNLKLLSAVAIAALSLSAVSAMAGEGEEGKMYARVGGSYGFAGKPGLRTDSQFQKASDFNSVIGLNDTSLKGYGGDVALGYYFTDCIRGDLSVTYSKMSNKKADLKLTDGTSDITFKDKMGMSRESFTGTLNAYYDFHTGSDFVPFVLGGIGVAHEKYDMAYDPRTASKGNEYASALISAGVLTADKAGSTTEGSVSAATAKKSHTKFMYQAGLGLKYKLSDAMALDLTYKLVNMPAVKGKTAGAIPATGTAVIKQGAEVGFKNTYKHTINLGLAFIF